MSQKNKTSSEQIISVLYKGKVPSKDNGLKFTEIVEKTDRAKSTISEQLTKLEENGAIFQAENSKYYLSEKASNKDDILSSIAGEETITLHNLVEKLEIERNILKPTITQLESMRLLEKNDGRIRITDRGLAEIGYCAGCKEPVDSDGMIVKATWRDDLGEFSVNIHPSCEAESLAEWCQAAGLPSNKDDFCSHCGLPLSPEALENMPEGFASRLTDMETDFDSWKDLFGPINTAYEQILDTGESFAVTQAFEARGFFVSYQENQKQYHPYCYKLQKEV